VERIIQKPVEQIKTEYKDKPVYIEKVIRKQVEKIVENPVEIEKNSYRKVINEIERPVYRESIITREVP
jgi:hypothetical protein